MAFHSATVTGSASNALGGSTVTIEAAIVPTGRALHVGDVDPRPVISVTKVAAGAEYKLALPVTDLVKSYAAVDGGTVNIELTSSGARSSQSTIAPFTLVAPSGERAAGEGAAGASLVATTGAAHWAAPVAHPLDTFPVPCSYTVKATQANNAEVAIFNSRTDESGSVSYGKKADSTIGVSFEQGGDGGNGADGSIGVSNSLGASVSQSYGPMTSNYVLTAFQGAQETRNPPPSGNEFCDNAAMEIRATGWIGGIDKGNPIPAGSSHQYKCATVVNNVTTYFGRNSHFTRDSSAAVDIDAGFTIFGTGLFTKSGYSSDTELHWSMGSEYAHHWFCGTVKPPTTSQIVWNGPNT